MHLLIEQTITGISGINSVSVYLDFGASTDPYIELTKAAMIFFSLNQTSFDNGRCSWKVLDLKELKCFEISELKGIIRIQYRPKHLDEF